MNNKRKTLLLVFGLIVLGIITMTVVYAALSTTLNITGNSEIAAASWDVKFKNLDIATTGEATYISPTLSNTSLTDFGATLMFGGDSVTFYVDVVNEGTVNAVLDSIVVGTPTCTETYARAGFRDGPCESPEAFFEHNFTYADGSAITSGDTLGAGETKHLKYELLFTEFGYDSFRGELIGTTVSLSNFNVTLLYVQD